MDETPLAFAVLAVLSIGCSADGPPAQNESTGADAGIDISRPANLRHLVETARRLAGDAHTQSGCTPDGGGDPPDGRSSRP